MPDSPRAEPGRSQQARPALDPERLVALRSLKRPDGTDMAGRLVGMFVETTPELLARIVSAVRAGRSADAATGAHELRGGASSIGALQLAAAAAELESVARAQEAPEPGLLERLSVEFERVRDEARALQERPSP